MGQLLDALTLVQQMDAGRRAVEEIVAKECDERAPVSWHLMMLGYEGYRLRVWYEPIEDEE